MSRLLLRVYNHCSSWIEITNQPYSIGLKSPISITHLEWDHQLPLVTHLNWNYTLDIPIHALWYTLLGIEIGQSWRLERKLKFAMCARVNFLVSWNSWMHRVENKHVCWVVVLSKMNSNRLTSGINGPGNKRKVLRWPGYSMNAKQIFMFVAIPARSAVGIQW